MTTTIATISPLSTAVPVTVSTSSSGTSRPTVILTNGPTCASFDADQARALAAALTTAADHVDAPRTLRRHVDADDAFREREG